MRSVVCVSFTLALAACATTRQAELELRENQENNSHLVVRRERKEAVQPVEEALPDEVKQPEPELIPLTLPTPAEIECRARGGEDCEETPAMDNSSEVSDEPVRTESF